MLKALISSILNMLEVPLKHIRISAWIIIYHYNLATNYEQWGRQEVTLLKNGIWYIQTYDTKISVVLRARVIPECLDNPNLNSLREVTSCQNSLSD